jgi:hypothetical protein
VPGWHVCRFRSAGCCWQPFWPPPQAALADFVHLTLQSQPGDWIGQGGTYDLTYTKNNSQFFVPGTVYQQVNGQPSYIWFSLGTVTPAPATNTYASLEFTTAQLGLPLQPGTYADAQRAPFEAPGHAGLDVTFQNRGSNTLTGSFTIHSLTYAPAPGSFAGLQMTSFDASFELHSGGARPALFGRIEYNIPVTAAEPPTLALVGLGVLGVFGCDWVRRRREQVRLARLAPATVAPATSSAHG